MLLRRTMQRRLVIAGLAAVAAAPVAPIQPAAAAILFTCDSADGSGAISPGLVRSQRAESFSSGPTAPAGPADIALASTSDAGVKGNSYSDQPDISADGTKVAFSSNATNLDPNDTDVPADVYVKDLTTGDIILASTSDAGAKGNGQSNWVSLSEDGTRVAFQSKANNLDPADTDATDDIYVKDLVTGDIALASTSDVGVKGWGDYPSISGDGMRVAFLSGATNLDPGDTDTVADIYVKDLVSGDITLASTSDTGVKGNDRSDAPSLSRTGGRVAFYSEATNVDPADTDSLLDIYVKDLASGNITLASTSDTAVKGNGHSSGVSLSDDGTRVGFTTGSTNLDPDDPDEIFDIYVKDLATGNITLASTSDSGVKSDHYSYDSALSSDGMKVLFRSSGNNLDPADSPFFDADAYVKDLASGNITLASASDTGVSDSGAIFSRSATLSGDGTRVAFSSTSTQLDPGDTDDLLDIYVKQLPATPTSIAIDECSNGQTGIASVVDLRSYGARPLGCPVSLGGAAGNDYPDQTPVLLGANPSLRIDWASGPDSFGVAKLKMGTTGTQWRAVLAIQASSGHDTPATNQYLPASGSGFTKTKLKGRIDWSALDSFNCTSGTADPLSWLDLINNGSFIVKNA
jgi:hypothetical protein